MLLYLSQTAAGEDWDLSDNVGWGPDFSDPSTYLDIIKPSVGENTRTYLGFDSGKDNEAAKKVGLNDYDKMVNEAGEETTDVTKRYNKYAEAQAWLTDSALVIPTTSKTGRPILSKMVPLLYLSLSQVTRGQAIRSDTNTLNFKTRQSLQMNIKKLKING